MNSLLLKILLLALVLHQLAGVESAAGMIAALREGLGVMRVALANDAGAAPLGGLRIGG